MWRGLDLGNRGMLFLTMYYTVSDLFSRVLIYLDIDLNNIHWKFKQDIPEAPIYNSGSGARSVINMSKYNRCNIEGFLTVSNTRFPTHRE